MSKRDVLKRAWDDRKLPGMQARWIQNWEIITLRIDVISLR